MSRKLIKPQTLKGFRDFLPETAIKRQYVIEKIRSVFESYGYDPVETPTLEYAETLLGKYGREADKLLYLFKDRGGRKVGLRYDQTVPTARLVAQYQNDLPRPWRRYQIQPVFRAEKPQKGRFREFLQVDADILGVKTILADAEIVALIYTIYKELGFKDFIIKINDRRVLVDMVVQSGVSEKLVMTVIRSLDKLEKIGREAVRQELETNGLAKKTIDNLFQCIKCVNRWEPDLPAPIRDLFSLLEQFEIPEGYYQFAPALARGLDYYTGLIFEVEIKNYQAGSVLGGGRYDKLIGQFTGQDVPAVGFSIGFDRTLEAMEKFGLLAVKKTNSQVLVTVFSPQLLEKSVKTATKIRLDGQVNVELYPDPTVKLDKQLKYADKKGIAYVVILGPEETAKKVVLVKNMKTGEQKEVGMDELRKYLKKISNF